MGNLVGLHYDEGGCRLLALFLKAPGLAVVRALDTTGDTTGDATDWAEELGALWPFASEAAPPPSVLSGHAASFTPY